MLDLLRLAFLTFFVRPLSLLWPKDKNVVAFMPREGTRFIDNVAHFYANLEARGLLPVGAYLLVTDPAVAKYWRARGRSVRTYTPSSLEHLLTYLRTSVVVTDNWQWAKEGRFACFRGAKKVQIWHGIPLKRIELSNLAGRAPTGPKRILHALKCWAQGRYPYYDIVVSTSDFFRDHAFRDSFVAGSFPNTGYPRNDFLLAPAGQEAQVDGDGLTLRTLERLRAEGKRVVLYAPTFRDTGGTPFDDSALDLLDLYDFAKSNDLVVVVKLHPYVAAPPPSFLWPHVIVYDASKDAAPLLKLTDLLVTDYSSIYFDYLLLDRPIVFFPYDFEKYYRHDRTFLFDYDEMTPGPKCFDQRAFFETVLQELDAPDEAWQERRRALKAKSFAHPDAEASVRLWREIEALL